MLKNDNQPSANGTSQDLYKFCNVSENLNEVFGKIDCCIIFDIDIYWILYTK
jgi:hypothetical protein